MMSEQEYRRKRRQMPSIFDLEKEIEERDRVEREAMAREWLKNRLLYSEEPADRLAVKAVVADLISYACTEEVHSSHDYEHKKKLFGRTEDREWHHRSVRRTVVER